MFKLNNGEIMKNIIKKSLLCLSLLTMNTSFLICMDSLSLEDKALENAVRAGQIEEVSQALRNGANPNGVYGQYNTTPLEIAVRETLYVLNQNDEDTRLKIIELLLQNKANVNTVDLWGGTPLEYAVGRFDPQLPLIRMLLRYGANIFHKNEGGITMLDKAKAERPEIKKLFEDYVNLLQRVLSNPNKQTLRYAIEGDYHLIVKRLIHQGMPVNECDLEFAKYFGSKMSGRIILDQLKLTSPIGRISTTGFETEPQLPVEVLENIGRLSH